MVTKRFHEIEQQPFATKRWARPTNPVMQWIDGVPGRPFDRGKPDECRWLIFAGETKFVSYRPLTDEPTLFRIFAELDSTEESFRGFANRYGLLGIQDAFLIGRQLMFGEQLARWRAEHANLRQVLRVLDCLKTCRTSGLTAMLETIPPERARHVTDFSSPREFWVEWVRTTISHMLRGTTGSGDSVVLALERTARRRLRLEFVPRSLLAVLWLQCARLAEGSQKYRRCRNCDSWFLISPEGFGRRRQAIYCSSRCNVQAFRKRNPVPRRRQLRPEKPRRAK